MYIYWIPVSDVDADRRSDHEYRKMAEIEESKTAKAEIRVKKIRLGHVLSERNDDMQVQINVSKKRKRRGENIESETVMKSRVFTHKKMNRDRHTNMITKKKIRDIYNKTRDDPSDLECEAHEE